MGGASRRGGLAGAGLAVALAACAAPRPPSASPARPPTGADPPPYTPAAAAIPRTDAPAAAPLDGGTARARSVALAALDALAREDRDAVEELLAERLARVEGGGGPATVTREQVLRVLYDSASARRARRRARPAPPFEELVRTEGIRIEPLSERYPGPRPDTWLRPDDLVVEVPLTTAGQSIFGRLVSTWRREARVVIRRGGDGRIVGL